jgi:hypothetical protein
MKPIDIELTFRLQNKNLPSIEEHYNRLWQFALVLEKYANMPIDEWYPAADTPQASRLNSAFDRLGATAAAIAMAKAAKAHEGGFGTLGVWNGIEERQGGSSFSTSLSEKGLCSMDFGAAGIPTLYNYKILVSILTDALAIWPSMVATIGILTMKYFTEYQVFKDRPGVGWMLYLPKTLTIQQVPEARALVPVMKDKKQIGTIIVSVTDAPFDVNNPEHIKIANAIEIRLVDQDLLPRFVDL